MADEVLKDIKAVEAWLGKMFPGQPIAEFDASKSDLKLFLDNGGVMVIDETGKKISAAEIKDGKPQTTDLLPDTINSFFTAVNRQVDAQAAAAQADKAGEQKPEAAAPATEPPPDESTTKDEGNPLTRNVNSLLMAAAAGAAIFFTPIGEAFGLMGVAIAAAVAFFVSKVVLKLDTPSESQGEHTPSATPGVQPEAAAGEAQDLAQEAPAAEVEQEVAEEPAAEAEIPKAAESPKEEKVKEPGEEKSPAAAAPQPAADANPTSDASATAPARNAVDTITEQKKAAEERQKAEEAAIKALAMDIKVDGVPRKIIEPVDGKIPVPPGGMSGRQPQAFKTQFSDGKPIVFDGYFHTVGKKRFYTLTGVTRYDVHKKHPEQTGPRRYIATGNAALRAFPTDMRFEADENGFNFGAVQQEVIAAATPLIKNVDDTAAQAKNARETRAAAHEARGITEVNAAKEKQINEIKERPAITIPNMPKIATNETIDVEGTIVSVGSDNQFHTHQFRGQFTQHGWNMTSEGKLTITELYTIDNPNIPSNNVIHNNPVTISLGTRGHGQYVPYYQVPSPHTAPLIGALEKGTQDAAAAAAIQAAKDATAKAAAEKAALQQKLEARKANAIPKPASKNPTAGPKKPEAQKADAPANNKNYETLTKEDLATVAKAAIPENLQMVAALAHLPIDNKSNTLGEKLKFAWAHASELIPAIPTSSTAPKKPEEQHNKKNKPTAPRT